MAALKPSPTSAPSSGPKHRLERRRTIPAPRPEQVRRTLARVILGSGTAQTWPVDLPERAPE